MVKQMDGLLSNLARASRAMAQSKQPDAFKTQWMPALAAARDRAEKLRPLIIKNPEQMEANLADAWRDREAGTAVELRSPANNGAASKPNASAEPLLLAPGQRVRHIRYGDGVVTRIDGDGPAAMIAILFDAAAERTFQADLLYDKVELVEG